MANLLARRLPDQVALLVQRYLPTVFRRHGIADVFSNGGGQFRAMDNQHSFAVQVDRPKVDVERANEQGFPVKHHCLGMQADSTLFRSEEHTSELQSRPHLVCRLLLEKKKKQT